MHKLWLGLGLLGLFAAGCVVGASRAGVSKANAGYVVEQRWSYFCLQSESVDDLTFRSNAAGMRGWELVTAAPTTAGAPIWCFRQPKP